MYAAGRNVQSVWRTIGKYLKKAEVFLEAQWQRIYLSVQETQETQV